MGCCGNIPAAPYRFLRYQLHCKKFIDIDIDIILQTLIQDYRLVRNVLQMDVCVTITLYLIRRKNILISKRDPEEEAAQTSFLLACFTVCETVG